MSHPDTLEHIVVVKVGSSTLVGSAGVLDRAYIANLADQLAALKKSGYHVILVSSGAVAAGLECLGMTERPRDIPGLQAAAAAGQALLMQAYAEAFGTHGLAVAQVLLTRRDVMDRDAYLNARNTIDRLLELGSVPIVNENDTVSVEEFTFGDNDMLGAIVAALVGAERYIVLSDIDGLYTANPATDPRATLVPEVRCVGAALMQTAGGAGSAVGTGGMTSKLRAARALIAAGIKMTIANGRRPNVLPEVMAGSCPRTDFYDATRSREQARKLWIGLATKVRGSVTVDAGAKKALIERGASLLPVGVISVEGTFNAGDVVSVLSQAGELIARGKIAYDSSVLNKTRGLSLDVIKRFYPDLADKPAIHRDFLLVF